MDSSLVAWIQQLNQIKLGLLSVFMLAFSIVIVIVTFKISRKVREEYDSSETEVTSKKTLRRYLVVCIGGPFLETLLVQASLYCLLHFILGSSRYFSEIYLGAVTLVFAALHALGGGLFDMIGRIPLGILLGVTYLYGIVHETHAVLITTLYHGIWNSVVVLIIPKIRLFDSFDTAQKE